jgi:hypothetical protein
MTEQKKAGRTLIANSPDLDDGEKAAIVAVKAYERVDKAIRTFMSEHTKVFKPFAELLEKLEAKRMIADAAMRSTDASFGPWQRSEQRTYDTVLLHELIGEEKFLELGGTVSEVPVYELEKDKLELAIVAEKIASTVVEKIRTITPKYRAPKARAQIG